MEWNLTLAINILLWTSLASWFFANKEGMKFSLVYTIFSLTLYAREDSFLNAVSMFLFLILLINKTEIRGALIIAITLLAISATNSSVALAQALSTPPVPMDIFEIRNLTVASAMVTSSIFVLPRHKNYLITLTLLSFSLFFYSYSNPHNIFAMLNAVSFPFACLSFIPYLVLTIFNNHFEGSFTYHYLTKALKVIAKRLKDESSSKYAGLALQILKLR